MDTNIKIYGSTALTVSDNPNIRCTGNNRARSVDVRKRGRKNLFYLNHDSMLVDFALVPTQNKKDRFLLTRLLIVLRIG